MKTLTRNFLTIPLAIVLLMPFTAQCYYNPSTGRWLSRDPITEPGFETTAQRAKTLADLEMQKDDADLAELARAMPRLGSMVNRVREELRKRFGERPENFAAGEDYTFLRNDPVSKSDVLG